MQPPEYNREQLDAQYRVRDAVPDFRSYLDRWTDDSAAVRRTLSGERDIRYGPSADETLDVFVPAGRVEHAPVQILIHGGYWRALSKDDFSFLAAAIVPAGVVAVVVNYALCPNVTMSALVDQCRRAMIWTSSNIERFGGDASRLHLTGHSAGAHLAAMMAATDWDSIPGGVVPCLRSVCGLSGLYDLRPLRQAFIQADLRLTEPEARDNSPLLLPFRADCNLLLAAGAAETDAFRWQTAAYAASMRSRVADCVTMEIPGHHHYSIVGVLCDADAPLRKAWIGRSLA